MFFDFLLRSCYICLSKSIRDENFVVVWKLLLSTFLPLDFLLGKEKSLNTETASRSLFSKPFGPMDMYTLVDCLCGFFL